MKSLDQERHSAHRTSTEHFTSLQATQRECLSNLRLLIRRVQRGQARGAETSAAAEVNIVDGEVVTVEGTSLCEAMAIKSKSIQKQIPKRTRVGDHNTRECKRAEESFEAGVLTGRRQFEN